jgi:hypothetical protein
MGDSELDQWLAKRRAGQAGQTAPQAPAPVTTGGSDLDQWLAKRRQGAKTAQPAPAQPRPAATPDSSFGPLYESLADQGRRAKEARQAAFNAKPFTERWGERTYDALARSGAGLSDMAKNAYAMGGQLLNPGVPIIASGADPRPEGLKRWENERRAELEARRQGRPSSLATDIIEGTIEAAPQVGVAGVLTAAGIPAPLVGGGMSALQADWRNPKQAALQTGVGAVAPIVGGKIGSKVGGAVASRLSRPIAQAAARAGGEVLGGAAGNVAGAAAMGERDPRQLIKAAGVGAALSAPGAVTAARGTAINTRVPFREVMPTQELPAVQGPGRPTAEIPVARATSPDAPTAELQPAAQLRETLDAARMYQEFQKEGGWSEGAPLERLMAMRQSQALPIREQSRTGDLPELYSAPLEPFEVHTGKVYPDQPGAVGPRAIDELGFQQTANLQPKAQAPVAPPPIDADLGQLWGRQPEQQGLFKGAPSQKVGWLEKLTALRRAGLLTNPATHGRNVGGTWFNQAAEEVSRIPASIVDLTVSAFTGRRTVAGPSPSAVVRSFREAATRGRRDAVDIMRKGAAPEDLERLQLNDPTFSNPIAKAYTQVVFRSLGAADRVANVFAYRRSLEERALSQARTEARQNKNLDVGARAKELAANPSAEMAAGAVNDALVSTFNNENVVNRFISAGKQKVAQYPGGRAAGFAVDLVAPFVKTPTNAVARTLEYSGGGFVKGGAGIAKAIVQRSMTPAQQREISRSLGRAATGTAGLITMGYVLASKGYLTGFSEEDEGRRNRDVAAGRQPGSIYDPVFGKWRRISGFAPVSTLLLIGATIQREHERAGEKREKSAFDRYAGIGAQVVGESPLAIGSKDVAKSLTQPSSLAEKAGAFAGSFVPSIVSGAGAAMDDREREGRGFVGQVEKRVPYLRESLPEQTDVLGRPVEHRRFDSINPAPGSTAKDKSDPLMQELVRLDVGLTAPQQKKDEGETDAEYRERKAKAGRWLQTYGAKLIASRAYQTASKEEQRAVWRKLQTAIHDESDEAYPSTDRFSAAAIIEAIRESAYQKREKKRAKSK